MSIKRILFLLIAIFMSIVVCAMFWNMYVDIAVSPGLEYEKLNEPEGGNANDANENIKIDIEENKEAPILDENSVGEEKDVLLGDDGATAAGEADLNVGAGEPAANNQSNDNISKQLNRLR